MEGDKYVPDPAERAAWSVFEQWLNTQLPKGTGRKKVPRPWTGKKPTYKVATEPVMTPARERRRDRLAELF